MGCSWSRRAAANSFDSKQEVYQTPLNGGQRQKERRNTGFVGLESPLSAGRRTANGHSALNRRDTPSKAATENGFVVACCIAFTSFSLQSPDDRRAARCKADRPDGQQQPDGVLSNAGGEDRSRPGRLQRLRNGEMNEECGYLPHARLALNECE